MLKAPQVPGRFAEVGGKGPPLVMITFSSPQKTARSSDPAQCRMPLHSARSGPAPQPVPATSSVPLPCAVSSLKSAAPFCPRQDGVYVPLTDYLS